MSRFIGSDAECNHIVSQMPKIREKLLGGHRSATKEEMPVRLGLKGRGSGEKDEQKLWMNILGGWASKKGDRPWLGDRP